MEVHQHKTGSDRVGIVAAVLCMIHCMIVPLAFALKVWWSTHTIYTLPWWWGMLDYFFLVVSFIAVYHSSSHAVSKGVKFSFWFFWGVLTLAIVFEGYIHWLAYLASTGLIATHVVNLRMQGRIGKLQG
jgi:hypothetical protein